MADVISKNKEKPELITIFHGYSLQHDSKLHAEFHTPASFIGEDYEEKGILHSQNIGLSHISNFMGSTGSSNPTRFGVTPRYITTGFVKAKDKVEKWLRVNKVLILYGASGTGKTTFAQLFAVHQATLSARKFEQVIFGTLQNHPENESFLEYEELLTGLGVTFKSPTLVILDQFDLSNITALNAVFQCSPLLRKVSLLIIGSSHSMPCPRLGRLLEESKDSERRVRFFMMKFTLTQLECSVFLERPVDEETLQRSTYRVLFRGIVSTFQDCEEGNKENFKKDLHEIVGDSVDKILAYHGESLAVTKCIENLYKFPHTQALKALLQFSYIEPYQNVWDKTVLDDTNKEPVLYISNDHRVDYFMKAKDGVQLCSTLCQQPSLLLQKHCKYSHEYMTISAAAARQENAVKMGNLFEQLFFLDLYYEGERLHSPQGYKVIERPTVSFMKMGPPQPLLMQHPCIECSITVMRHIVQKRKKRPCFQCQSSNSKIHSMCYFANVNRYKPNFPGWDYIHISEEHDGPTKTLTCVQLFQITMNKNHKKETMKSTYRDLLDDIEEAKMSTTVELYWIVNVDLPMSEQIEVDGNIVPVTKIVKEPNFIAFLKCQSPADASKN